MAVVSISRIQVRRGTALQGTGLPQLASGEFGWAIDTQELYIGNGSTAEGAPAVGNTRILTERTNVLDLAGQYTYRQDSNIQTSEAGAVERTIAERLDDRVSVRAFGVTATAGSSTQTQQLQKALYELYLRDDSPTTAPVLHVEEGEFTITETIYVPPYTTIIGAGKDRTVFKKTGSFPMFQTISDGDESVYNGTLATAIPVSDPSVAANALENQARDVRLEHMTLEAGDSSSSTRSYLLMLNNCRDSVFKSVRFKYAPTDITDSTPVIAENEIAIGFVSKNDTVGANSNKFIDCDFIGLDEAAYGPYTVKSNTFVRCTFNWLRRGVVLGESLAVGQEGPMDNVVTDSDFDNIYEHAFLAPTGTGNRSEKNRYGDSVGNAGGSAGTATYPIVSYGERGNLSIDDTFERTYNLAMNNSFTPNTRYFPEVEGPVFYTNGSYQHTRLAVGAFERTAFRLPADTTKFYTVEYFYKSNSALYPTRNFTRSGVLEIIVNREDDTVEITDNYEAAGEIGTFDNPSGFAENIKFQGEIQYDDPVQKNIVWAANITTSNPNDEGDLTIKITTKS